MFFRVNATHWCLNATLLIIKCKFQYALSKEYLFHNLDLFQLVILILKCNRKLYFCCHDYGRLLHTCQTCLHDKNAPQYWMIPQLSFSIIWNTIYWLLTCYVRMCTNPCFYIAIIKWFLFLFWQLKWNLHTVPFLPFLAVSFCLPFDSIAVYSEYVYFIKQGAHTKLIVVWRLSASRSALSLMWWTHFKWLVNCSSRFLPHIRQSFLYLTIHF